MTAYSLKYFRINKTLKQAKGGNGTAQGLKYFRINKTLKHPDAEPVPAIGLKYFRINKTLKLLKGNGKAVQMFEILPN